MALQHIRNEKSFFTARQVFLTCPGEWCLHSRKSPLWVWLPTWGVSQLLTPWKPLSAPNALRLRPSKLCSFKVVDEKFPNRLSALALGYKTSRPCNRASASSSHFKSRAPFCFPEGLAQVRTACFLGLSDLSGFPASDPCEKPSPLLTSPLRCFHSNILRWRSEAA